MSHQATNKIHLALAAVFAVVLFGTLSVPMANPEPAQAQIPALASAVGVSLIPCGLIPDGTVEDVCNAATDPVGTAASAVGVNIPGIPSPTKILGSALNSTFGSLLKDIVDAEVGSMVDMLNGLAKTVVNSSTPSLTSHWFLKQYAIILGIGVFLAYGLFFGKIGESVANAEIATMFKAGGVLMLFLILGGSIPWIVQSITNVADKEIAAGLFNSAGNDFRDAMSELGKVDFTKSLQSPGNNPAVALLVPAITLFFGVLLGIVMKFELLFREGMLYAVTGGLALTMAMAVAGRWGEEMVRSSFMVLVALMFYNVAAAFIMTLGIGLISVAKADPITLGVVVISMMPILTVVFYRFVSKHKVNGRGTAASIAQIRAMFA